MKYLGYILSKVYPEQIMKGLIVVRDDGQGPYIEKWDQSLGEMPSTESLDTMLHEELLKESLDSIDNIAYSKIIKIAPEHVQRNMTARGAELLEKIVEGGTLSTEEQAERLVIKDIWARIKTIRVHAKYLKEEVLAGNNPNIEEGWPE